MSVTALRQSPPLTDIAGRLRALADDIDAGRIAPRVLVAVWDDPERMVAGAAFGEVGDRFSVAGLLATAAAKATSGAW